MLPGLYNEHEPQAKAPSAVTKMTPSTPDRFVLQGLKLAVVPGGC